MSKDVRIKVGDGRVKNKLKASCQDLRPEVMQPTNCFLAAVGLDIFRHRYCHKSIDDAVEHAETCVSSSLFEGSPAKFFQHRCSIGKIGR